MTDKQIVYECAVQSKWIDYNGHMGDYCYVEVFSKAVDAFMTAIGLDQNFRTLYQVSLYTLQSVVTYLKEVSEAEPLQIAMQLLECDSKKLRVFFTMCHGRTGAELAVMETLLLHVDMITRSASPFLPATLNRLTDLLTQQADIAWPAQAGRGIAMKRVQ